ncbi:hypothetical protein ACFCP7_10455 [Paenibacillus elgii]
MKQPAQGYDVSVMVVGANGPELVGEFQNIELNISSDFEEYQTTNSRMPILLDGEVKIDGSLKRGMIDVGRALRVLFGSSQLAPGQRFTAPRYTITASFNAPEKGLVGRYVLTNCIFPSLSLSVQNGKNVVSSDYKFRAEGVQEAA